MNRCQDVRTIAESKRISAMTDQQVLDVLKARGSELKTLDAFQFLIRMFEKAAETNPTAAVGLRLAVGLVHIYGQNFAPGHECHPFKQYGGLSVSGLLSAMPPRAPTRKPVVAEAKEVAPVIHVGTGRLVGKIPELGMGYSIPKTGRVHGADPYKEVAGKIFDLDGRMEGQREVTARVSTDGLDMESYSTQPLTSLMKGWPRGSGAVNGGKSGAIQKFIMSAEGEFTVNDIAAACLALGSKMDVNNAFAALRRKGKLESSVSQYGAWRIKTASLTVNSQESP